MSVSKNLDPQFSCARAIDVSNMYKCCAQWFSFGKSCISIGIRRHLDLSINYRIKIVKSDILSSFFYLACNVSYCWAKTSPSTTSYYVHIKLKLNKNFLVIKM